MRRQLLGAAVLAGLLTGTAQAQWLDTTLYLGVGLGPNALVYDSVSNKVYCANYAGDNVTVIDGATNQVITTMRAGSGPYALCSNPQDNKVYCANYDSHSVTVIDGASNQVITTVAAGSGPCALCYNPQDNKVYCANPATNDVTVIGGASDSVVKTMPVGIGPCALTCNPAENRVYVANCKSNSISIIRDSALVGMQEHAPLAGYHLSLEAYPNPFSGLIRLRLTANGLRPEVRIYDVNGALVRSFPKSAVRSSQFESPRFLTWDGTDGMGRRLPPGVYVVRLTDGASSVNRKVMLLR